MILTETIRCLVDNRRYVDERVFLFKDNCRVSREDTSLIIQSDSNKEVLTLTCDTVQTALLWHRYCTYLINAAVTEEQTIST